MGIIILRRRYDFSKYLAVLMITAGILICTIISGSNVVSEELEQMLSIFPIRSFKLIPFQKSMSDPELVKDASESGYSVFFWWLCGIFLLVTALLISARMGIYQEVLYKRHGKHAREALYVTVRSLSFNLLRHHLI